MVNLEGLQQDLIALRKRARALKSFLTEIKVELAKLQEKIRKRKAEENEDAHRETRD